MNSHTASTTELRRDTAQQRNTPAFRVVPVDMDVKRPIVEHMSGEFFHEVESARDPDIGAAGRSSRLNIKYIALQPHLPHSCVHGPHVHGHSAVGGRVRTDQEDFHQ